MFAARKIFRSSLNLYFPHEGNGYKARLLHPSGFFLIKVVLILLQVVMQFAIASPLPNILGYAANISKSEVIRLTNLKRAENGTAPLKENSTLSDQAYQKGKHMLDHDYWAHVAPDGTEPWYFFKEGGYQYRFAGENLARDFSDPSSAVDAWMASPSHRENLLSDKYREIGIGVVEGDLEGIDTTIIVQFFGTKLSDTLPREPLAQTDSTTTSFDAANKPFEKAVPTPIVASTKISPFWTTRNASLIVVAVLSSLLIVDWVMVSRRRVRRIGGRIFAHLAFLGMVAVIILLLKAGEII